MAMSDPQKKWFWSDHSQEIECLEMRQHPENGGWYCGKEYVVEANKAFNSELDCINNQIDQFEARIDELKKQKFKYM